MRPGEYVRREKKALLVLLVGSELSPCSGLLETRDMEYVSLIILILMASKKYVLLYLGPKPFSCEGTLYLLRKIIQV